MNHIVCKIKLLGPCVDDTSLSRRTVCHRSCWAGLVGHDVVSVGLVSHVFCLRLPFVLVLLSILVLALLLLLAGLEWLGCPAGFAGCLERWCLGVIHAAFAITCIALNLGASALITDQLFRFNAGFLLLLLLACLLNHATIAITCNDFTLCASALISAQLSRFNAVSLPLSSCLSLPWSLSRASSGPLAWCQPLLPAPSCSSLPWSLS